MKLSLFRLILLAGTWMILGSARPLPTHQLSNAKQTVYYWFWADTDVFFEQATTATAINDWENLTGHLVNTLSTGGTPLGNGYQSAVQPHTTLPAIMLYEH